MMESMKVCHFSDLRGFKEELPEADYYVCTGNILPYNEDPRVNIFQQRIQQAEYVRTSVNWRSYFGKGQAPVILVRGPKDLVNPAYLFEGGPLFMIEDSDRTHVINHAQVGGFRGVLSEGPLERDDYLTMFAARQKVNKLNPKLDYLITHSHSMAMGNRNGIPGLGSYIKEKLVMRDGVTPTYVGRLRAHFHGCDPRGFGSRFEGGQNGILISNATGGFILYHKIGSVWHVRNQRNLFPEKVEQQTKVINENSIPNDDVDYYWGM